MTKVADHLKELVSLAEQQATGEYVAATSMREFHVCLAQGRVAWASDTAQAGLFTTLICREANVDRSTFAEVVAECRRSRMPLGETLCSLGLATPEQVQRALAQQARDVIAGLWSLESATSIFLPRPRWAEQPHRFLFPLTELIPAAPQPDLQETPKPFSSAGDGPELLKALKSEPAWAISSAEGVGRSGDAQQLLAQLTTADASFVAYRGAQACAFVVRAGAQHPLLFGFGSVGPLPTTIGIVAALGLCSYGSAPAQARHGKRWREPAAGDQLTDALERALEWSDAIDFIVAARATARDRWSGVGRRRDEAEAGLREVEWARSVCRSFERLCARGADGSTEVARDLLLVVRDGRLRCFALDEVRGDVVAAVTQTHAPCSIGMAIGISSLAIREAVAAFGALPQPPSRGA